MEIAEVTEWLLTKGYAVDTKGKLSLTPHFQKAYSHIIDWLTLKTEPGSMLPATTTKSAPLIPVKENVSLYKYEDWVSMFMQFIQDAKIPRRCVLSNGDLYDTNKYSEDGMKAFQKAIRAGYNYEILVKATMLAYKSGTKAKKTIGNYMTQGDWRTNYDELVAVAQQGAAELTNHIKAELKDGSYDGYTIG